MSFCGSGFLGIYHLGATKALITKAPKFINRVNKYGGASAGSLVACILTVFGPNLQVIEVRSTV